MINSYVLNRELNLPRKCVVLEVTLCSFVKLYRRFRDTGGRKGFLWGVGGHFADYEVLHRSWK